MQWDEDAACQTSDPSIFFPERGDNPEIAKRICRRCDVREDCLRHAMKMPEEFGIWGGLDERERSQMRTRKFRRINDNVN